MTDALERLIEAVEAGNADWPTFMAYLPKTCIRWAGGLYPTVASAAFAAYAHGDLNAANALHDALLPGWRCEINWKPGEAADACVSNGSGDEIEWGDAQQSASAARTWLLAILRAKLSEAKNHQRQETSV